jgi:CO/xanthine dehydrogenase Mo-binding subunit
VTFDRSRVTSVDWETYPILRFFEVPEVETVLLDRPGEPCLGAGEATQGPTAGAIANAIFDAVGVRLRDLPFTPARLRDAAL